jgi:hypothetical protein
LEIKFGIKSATKFLTPWIQARFRCVCPAKLRGRSCSHRPANEGSRPMDGLRLGFGLELRLELG